MRDKRGGPPAGGRAAKRCRLALRVAGGGREVVKAGAEVAPAQDPAARARVAGVDAEGEFWTSWLNARVLLAAAGAAVPRRSAAASAFHGALTALRALRERGAEVAAPYARLAAHVDKGRLAVRPGVDVARDPGVRAHIAAALGSYSPVWLVLGLEVAIGGLGGLLARVSDHLSWDEGLGNGAGEAPSSSSLADEVVQAALDSVLSQSSSESMLKALLLYVLLLDRAALRGLGGLGGASSPASLGAADALPTLFRRGAACTSSADVVSSLAVTPAGDRAARACLVGGGNLLRHLGFIGYRVRYAQPPAAGYAYAVTNLAEDLRDGVRLCCLAGALSGDWSALAAARPPNAAAQGEHRRRAATRNLRIALETLGLELMSGSEVNMANLAAALADGSRTATLALLWRVASAWQARRLAPAALLRAEAARLRAAARAARHTPTSWYERLEEEARVSDLENAAGGDVAARHAALLLEWASAACAAHPSCPVVLDASGHLGDDGGGSTSTGTSSGSRALCTIIGLYAPDLVSADALAVSNEGRLQRAAHSLCLESGLKPRAGVPLASGAGAMQLSELAAALLSRDDVARQRAAFVVQAAWRARLERAARPRRVAAAVVMQRALRARGRRRAEAATCVQAAYRRYITRRAAAARTRAAVALQAAWRRALARRRVASMRAAAHAAVRGAAAVAIQAAWRGARARWAFQKHSAAATRVQDAWRTAMVRSRFVRLRRAASRLQVAWRARHAARNAAAMAIQTTWRGHLARQAAGGDERVAAARRAIRRAAARACPEDTLWARTLAALEALEAHLNRRLDATAAAEAAERLRCAATMSGRVAALLASAPHHRRLMLAGRGAGRGAHGVRLAEAAIGALAAACACRGAQGAAERIARLPDCGVAMAEQLQRYRDKAGAFSAALAVLERVVACPERAAALAREAAPARARLATLAGVLRAEAAQRRQWAALRQRAHASQPEPSDHVTTGNASGEREQALEALERVLEQIPAAPSAEASRSAANALPKSKDEVAEARPKPQRAPLGELPRNAAAIVG